MTTGWGEAFSNARQLEGNGDKPVRDQSAAAAAYASDAFDVPASSGAMCLNGRLPEWPETAVYVYI